MKNQNNQLLKLWFLQATETLCHLSITDIKKRFCHVWFFCINEACVNCGKENSTTLSWLLWGLSTAGIHIQLFLFKKTNQINRNIKQKKLFQNTAKQALSTNKAGCFLLVQTLKNCLCRKFMFDWKDSSDYILERLKWP